MRRTAGKYGDKTAMMDQIRALLSPNRPWLHLLYLGFFFFGWLYQPPGPGQAIVALVAMAGFIIAYIFTLRRSDWTVYPAAFGAAALGFALMPQTMGGGVYFVFAAAMLGWLPASRMRNAALALLTVAVMAGVWLVQAPVYIGAVLLVLGAMASSGAMIGARRRGQEARAQAHQSRAAALAAEAERQRIARDLHDLLGHTLSVVTLKADLASRLFDADPGRARAELAEIQSISRTALAEVREAVAGLRDRSLDDAANEARRRLEAAGLAVSLQLEPVRLSPQQSTALAMVVREAATNILRHAGAGTAAIRLSRSGDMIRLIVGDDGVGGARLGDGGLGGLSARLQALSGELSIEVPPSGQGSAIMACLPAGAAEMGRRDGRS